MFYHHLNESTAIAERRPYGIIHTTTVTRRNKLTNRLRRVLRPKQS
ncbi:hypothetical protein IPL68_07445 [Candidatus Saccharibacteria bacterium]|nr:MAG: hypothetical protein IPL68_07445 [Candidatus Saccharibacteria bacterium]